MRRRDRNILLQLVRDAEIDPDVFTVTYKEEETSLGLKNDVFRLRVRDTPLFFSVYSTFRDESREFAYQASTFRIPNDFGSPSAWNIGCTFTTLQQSFTDWLTGPVTKYVIHYDEELQDQMTPDLWAELSRAPSAIGLQNTRFTLEEQTRIEKDLRQFERTVNTQNFLSEEQASLLSTEIENLIATSKKFGRKDWLNMAGGALMGFSVQVGLTSEATLQVLRLAGQALRWIAQTPLLLP